MRLKRLIRRQSWVLGIGCVFLIGMYFGRISVTHYWWEHFALGAWFCNALMFFIPIHREWKREEREFRETMRKLTEEIQRQYPRIDD